MGMNVLAVCCGKKALLSAQQECIKYGLLVQTTESLSEAVGELTGGACFLLVVLYGGGDILETVRVVRSLTDTPILVLREVYDGAEKIATIKAGADEYIRYPDTAAEWIASAQALIRRRRGVTCDGDNEELFSGAGFCVDKKRRLVVFNGQEIRFPRKEFNLFILLAESPGYIFTKEQIYREIWGAGSYHAAENSINSCLRRIRRKLEELPESFCRIENKKGVGYYFIKQKYEMQ